MAGEHKVNEFPEIKMAGENQVIREFVNGNFGR
jgi:hypothetical protein